MNSAVHKKKTLTKEAYLALERDSDIRHELVDGELFAMVGATKRHNWIGFNIARELGNKLKGSGCMGALNDQRVRIPDTDNYLYPDVVVACEGAEYIEEELDTLLTPTAVFEILSDSTEKYDRDLKFDLYAGIASLEEYVLVSQDRVLVELFRREKKGEMWHYFKFNSRAHHLPLKSIARELSLAEIYYHIEFSDAIR